MSILDYIKSLFAPKPIFGQDNGEGRSYVVNKAATNPNINVYNPSPQEQAIINAGRANLNTTSTNQVPRNLTTDKDGGDGDGGGGNGGDSGLSEAEIARQRYEARKREIESRLNAAKEYVKELIGGYETTRGKTMDTINTSYDKLKDTIAQKLQQSLAQLDQSDIGVQNMYGRLAGNARRAMENTLTKNNLLAKALGNAGSSWYQNLQSKSRNEGTASIYDTEAEQAAKRAAIGLEKGSANTTFGTYEADADRERAELLTKAEEKYNSDVANARLLERNYGIDSEAAIDEAQANLDEAYRQVNAYTASRQNAPTTGERYTTADTGAKNYSALNNIASTLNNNYAADKANNYLNNAGGAFNNPVSQYNYRNPSYFLKPQNKKEDETGYFQTD